MEVDDLFSAESAVVAAATAAVFSPRTRETLRRGAVLGVAGAMKVGDVVAGAARGATRGVRRGDSGSTAGSAGNGVSGGQAEAKTKPAAKPPAAPRARRGPESRSTGSAARTS